ncbi:hypothetical protein HDK64DRAFT_278606, partial [Phyllosticta capitalensis]
MSFALLVSLQLSTISTASTCTFTSYTSLSSFPTLSTVTPYKSPNSPIHLDVQSQHAQHGDIISPHTDDDGTPQLPRL